MKSKLIIFLAFVSLVQSTKRLKVSDDLSVNHLAILRKIIANQESSMIAYSNGFKHVFDILNRIAIESAINSKPKCYNHSSKLVEGFISVKKAVNLFLDSVLLVLGESCTAVKLARRTTHDNLEDVFTRITISLEFACTGNYHENQAAIEINQAGVRQDFTNLVKSTYDSIRTCLGITDSETLAVIIRAQSGSCNGLVHLTNALFNAIKDLTARVGVKCEDVALVPDIEDFWGKAIAGLNDDIEHKFSVLETLYINVYIHKRVIVSSLAVIRYAKIVGSNRFKEGNKVLFDTVISGLRRIALGYCDDGEIDFSRTDIARGKQVSKFSAGDAAFFSSMLILHPENSAAILQAQQSIFDLEEFGGTAFFEAINVALSPCKNRTETMDKIEVLRNATVSPAPVYTELIFSFIRNNQSFSEKNKAELKILEDKAALGAGSSTDKFFDAVVILAKDNCAGKVRNDDFCAIRELLAISNSGLDEYMQDVAAACILVLKTDTSS